MPNSVIETIRKHLRGNRIPDRMRAPPSYEKHQYLIIRWPQIIELTLAHDQVNTIIMGMENASLSGCHAWDNQHLRIPLYQHTFNRVHKRRKSYRSNHMLNITLPVWPLFGRYTAAQNGWVGRLHQYRYCLSSCTCNAALRGYCERQLWHTKMV